MASISEQHVLYQILFQFLWLKARFVHKVTITCHPLDPLEPWLNSYEKNLSVDIPALYKSWIAKCVVGYTFFYQLLPCFFA
jgi:hypothetical protein